MPKMKRFHAKKNRPTFRSHTSKWRGGKVRAYTHRKRPNQGISAITAVLNANKPQYGVVKSHIKTSIAPGTVVYTSLAYKANSIFNIDAAQGGTVDVRGIDALTVLYNNYDVFASKITVTILRSGMNQNFNVFLFPYTSIVNPATYGETIIANMPNCRKAYVQWNNTMQNSCKLIAKSHMAKIGGVTKRVISDNTDQYSAIIAGDPTALYYWNILIFAADNAAFASTDTIDVMIDISYNCRFQVKNILDETA